MVKISAGSYDLNKWLHGGYESDVVTVLYGGSGTGKTNFCLLAAVSQAKKGKKVIFVDSEGGFSVERVKQLVGIGEKEEAEKVLKNILVLKVTNFEEQKNAFEELLKNLRKDSSHEISLIIVDGMTMLYRLDFAAARDKGEKEIQKINSVLVEQTRTLAEIARKKEIPIIITNQVYRYQEESKMVGGDILKYWGKCHIELLHEKGRRSAKLRKHRSLAEKEFVFQIYDGGIRKRGWI
ncbi:DNA repair and recombination protein RadB [Candidatus Pacearchaeota archaeon]|nr:DNA repair and recombination protein RadB [Candidatus Pacearchaeota archaeon]|tara:strand:- start:419 stop:1129 length:711 start_codon:yes stop_codon:yes gene_type:complete